jgi:hypothetical protein
MGVGGYEEAIASLSRAERLDPKNVDIEKLMKVACREVRLALIYCLTYVVASQTIPFANQRLRNHAPIKYNDDETIIQYIYIYASLLHQALRELKRPD